MKKNLLIVILILLLAGAGYYAFLRPNECNIRVAEQKQLYTCPMHPQIVKDAPGDCPICGMTLVTVPKEEPKKVEVAVQKKKTMYRSTMNPNEISDRPGKDSMGMEMIPFGTQEGSDIKTLAGLAPITIPKEKRDLIGLSFSTVEMRDISKEIRTSARIVPDETRVFHVTLKISGWVEKLYVNQTGQYVKKGAPLLTLYSPELFAAQQEYLSSVQALDKLSKMPDSAVSGSVKDLEAAAREKLRLFDISNAQIERLQATGKVERTMTLYSPVTGYVTEKTVLEGHRIMMNETLMTIVDLSHVWGEADIYEMDLPYVKVGMAAELTLSYWPEEIFKGHISFLFPFLESETRTVKARIEIDNDKFLLKPGMYADARLSYNLGSRLAVPESAAMRTGVKDYVFLDGEDDLIVPYEVKLGVRSNDGYYEVNSDLKPGSRVVTSANFLIDSESSLKAALQSATEAAAQKN